MMNKDINLNLSQMANGAIQEKLQGELEKVFENIHDLNTEAAKKRTLTIKLEFKPDDSRQVVTLATDFKTTLAPVEGIVSNILTGKDINTGKIAANEMLSNSPGQMYMDVQDGQTKTDIGEPIDVIEQEVEKQKKIIDLQNRA